MNYDFSLFTSLIEAIDNLFVTKEKVVVAIDGKCGSGKSTLAAFLAQKYDSTIIHMDDFFLPLPLRTPQRLAEAGGNVHYERFFEQVYPYVKMLQEDQSLAAPVPYQLFDCRTFDYKAETGLIMDRPLTVVEGSYSMRPEFRPAYDLKVFLDIDADRQKERLLARNGAEAYQNFVNKWIPMELHYFDTLNISEKCDLIYHV